MEVYLIVKYIHNNFILNQSVHIKNIVVAGFEIVFLTGPQFQCCFVAYFKMEESMRGVSVQMHIL